MFSKIQMTKKKKISAKLGSFCLRNKIKIKIVNATPSNCKNNLKHSDTYSQNLILLDHHLIKPILNLILKR